MCLSATVFFRCLVLIYVFFLLFVEILTMSIYSSPDLGEYLFLFKGRMLISVSSSSFSEIISFYFF